MRKPVDRPFVKPTERLKQLRDLRIKARMDAMVWLPHSAHDEALEVNSMFEEFCKPRALAPNTSKLQSVLTCFRKWFA